MLSTTQSCGWYEFIFFMSSGLWMTWTTSVYQFRVMDDMNDLGSYEPKLLDAMNNLGLRIISMILGHEPMALNAMSSSRLCITWKTLSRELKALYVIKSLGFWLTRMSLGYELMALDVINNSRLLMTWAHDFGWYEQLRVVDDIDLLSCDLSPLDVMNSSWLWAHGSKCYERLRAMDDMNDSG